MFGNKKKLVDELQQQGGRVAWATVLNSDQQWDSSSGRSRTDHVKLNLRVEPDGGEPFEATFKQAFAGTYPMTGWQCKVIYDPADPSRIAVVEGSEAPPGVSHDRAERHAAIRAEATQAAISGNMAEFVEQLRTQQAAVGGQQSAAAPQADIADQITKLAALHQQGVLTDDEFQAAKAKLLG